LRALQRRLGRRMAPAHVHLGIGDDAALLRGSGRDEVVVSTDMLIEHVDFKRRWSSFADVGHKAAAVNLSDLAAMGAHAQGLFACLAARPGEQVADCLSLLCSLDRCGRRFGAPLLGGDLSRTSGPLVISVTAVGAVAAGTALRRGTGRLGDKILVSGTLGLAAAGLARLRQGKAAPASWLRAQRRPLPQMALAQALRATGWVTACADVSDGLSKDASLLVTAPLTVVLCADRLPLVPSVPRQQALRWALGGGEDYQLVCSVAPRHVAGVLAAGRAVGVRLHEVGEVAVGGRRQGKPMEPGFDHFR
jgi:thiamine-monophosphate kinase